MLELTIKGREFYDEEHEMFFTIPDTVLKLEHSLLSVSKWEAKWHKRFLDKGEKSSEEMLDYIKCMTINKNVPDHVYSCLTTKDINTINEYINDPMTATTFPNRHRASNGEAISNELIYYWMAANQIPFECEKWHLNHLLTLINVCGVKNEAPKKMSKRNVLNQNASLNAARRKAMHSKG